LIRVYPQVSSLEAPSINTATAKMVWYHVAEPNSYLVITGVGIQKVLIKKKV
jgi:hypothetical protein